MGEMRNACKIVVGKPEGKKPLERPWRGWEDDNRRDVREIGWKGVDWFHYFIIVLLLGCIPAGKRPLRRIRCRWRIILERILGKSDVMVWTGYFWFRIEASGGLL